jgi:hypothetical protein
MSFYNCLYGLEQYYLINANFTVGNSSLLVMEIGQWSVVMNEVG